VLVTDVSGAAVARLVAAAGLRFEAVARVVKTDAMKKVTFMIAEGQVSNVDVSIEESELTRCPGGCRPVCNRRSLPNTHDCVSA
jgi:hypothetical protein